MFDLVIRSDRVVTPAGVAACDVAIEGEKIAAVAAAGTFDAQKVRGGSIDATGKIVMPGGIDPHVHLQVVHAASRRHRHLYRPAVGREPRGALRRHYDDDRLRALDARQDDPAGDRRPPQGLDRAVLLRLQLPRHGRRLAAARKSSAQLAEALRAGYPTVKIFTTDITPSRRGRMVDFGDIWEVFKVVAQRARHVRDARRRQRHRDAHVRQADPRGPHRLREHGGGAQRDVGGPVVPPRARARARTCRASCSISCT